MIEESNCICNTHQAKESTGLPTLGVVMGLKRTSKAEGQDSQCNSEPLWLAISNLIDLSNNSHGFLSKGHSFYLGNTSLSLDRGTEHLLSILCMTEKYKGLRRSRCVVSLLNPFFVQ